MPRSRYRADPPRVPWTEQEDARLREICALGLVSDAWGTAIPTRTFGEIVERRLDLQIQMAPLL